MRERLRNIAIIAHVDHGKTTLVDRLFQQCGTLGRRDAGKERIMDSGDQERERGITILAKNTAIDWKGYRINIVDTPGHADFGGEVERILSMVDSVLLLVDAVDGPMPQTRFVTRKAFEAGLNPIVVVNKVDRPGARPHWVMDQVFDLFDRLGATEEQLDFPVIYASALNGVAGPEPDQLAEDMAPLLDLIIERVPPPPADIDGPFQMQICALDYSSYVGVIGIGRVKRGVARPGMQVAVIEADGTRRNARINAVLGQTGLEKAEIAEGEAGDIVSITGIENLKISSTLCDPATPEALPALTIDQPTVSMTFQVNDSPFAGREGQFVTSRNIRDRLERELLSDVALRVQDGSTPDRFVVSGRGELHLSVLIEKMRREGYEMGVSRPEVIRRVIDGIEQEPYESLLIDCEETHQGAIMEEIGKRRGELRDMVPDGKGRVRLEYMIPSRGIIGFRNQFLTMTSGTGVLNSIFDHYGPVKAGEVAARQNGVLVSMVPGKALGYALFSLQERGRLFIGPNVEVYEGQLIGIHSRDNDLAVNPTKGKQLTNIRAAGSDENILLTPPIRMSLEQALDFIDDDELVEVTPQNVRLRKKLLKEVDRRRAGRHREAV
ncbi:MAG: translational GTPase TypA [Pseudomonadales bacterium]|nr:translational GTPase TypA [Pseudomonadales bacterium]MCP5337110.1 translational GTPase TypA [Pseudomonadales bacterium]